MGQRSRAASAARLQPLVVIGSGGFGRDTLDIVEAVNGDRPTYRLLGVVDDNPKPRHIRYLRDRGIIHLGTVADFLASGLRAEYLIGVANPSVRWRTAAMLDEAGLSPATAIHPMAIIGSQVAIGAGTIICAGVQISANVELGRHVQLSPNSIIGYDAIIESFVTVNPGAIVSGDVTVETGALLGSGSIILEGCRVEYGAIAGAGTVVVNGVRPHAVVKGVPAR